jgi:homoserine O-succinyltransferase
LGRCIKIGLINNMPHAAFTATELQFISILDSASEGIPVHLSFYSLPGIPRPEAGGAGGVYSSVEALWDTNLDGLIVTGKEPITANLQDEPCWKSFTQAVDWARENTYSTVWSCLAAHAAVLHLDGISRRKSSEKNFGLFECVSASDSPLLEGAQRRFHVPHSRWNGIAEEDLAAHGYSVLTHTASSNVDTFVKEENSLFVFFQGHPEYDTDTLLREYRRDVGRYLRHESDTYPLVPHSYFNESTESALSILRDQAMSSRNEELFRSVGATLETARIENTWRRTAERIYRNWLQYINTRRIQSQLDADANVA